MNFEIKKAGGIKLTGIKIRTSNADAQTDIPKLWERFYSENIISKIPAKQSEDIFSVYTNYEGDHTKPYDVILGCEVSAVDDIPEGMVSKVIPEAKYAVFKAEGELPMGIVKVWQYVWSSCLDRTYAADFDHHKNTGDQSEVEIYVGIN